MNRLALERLPVVKLRFIHATDILRGGVVERSDVVSDLEKSLVEGQDATERISCPEGKGRRWASHIILQQD